MDNNGFEEVDVKPVTKTKRLSTDSDLQNNNNFSGMSSKHEKRMILKNIIIISIAFMLLFTAYQSMASLQSSINKDSNLGTYSLSVIYASVIISSMFVPSYLLRKIGAKWSMVMAMFCYSLYIGSQFYPRIYTLVPSALVVGFGAAPLWIAKCAYLTKAAYRYAELSGTTHQSVIVRFFGIFYLFFQSSQVWGNLISSWALGIGREVEVNQTIISEAILATCGVNYCPEPTIEFEELPGPITELESNLTILEAVTDENFKTTDTQINILVGIFLGCSLLSPFIIALLVDPVRRFTGDTVEGESMGEEPTGLSLVAATIKQMKKKSQQLLIPLTVWVGLQQGFFGADFTAAFISCGWGVHNVGFVMITFGVCDALFSMAFGSIIKLTGRIPIFLLGAVLNVTVIAVLFNWMPNPDQNYVFFILAGLWGTADAVWQTQINSLYGVIFAGKESSAGFSNYRLWESAGFILAYILQTQVCVFDKMWVMVAILFLGMTGYLTVEVLVRRKEIKEITKTP